jgi:hypothetical protein
MVCFFSGRAEYHRTGWKTAGFAGSSAGVKKRLTSSPRVCRFPFLIGGGDLSGEALAKPETFEVQRLDTEKAGTIKHAALLQ